MQICLLVFKPLRDIYDAVDAIQHRDAALLPEVLPPTFTCGRHFALRHVMIRTVNWRVPRYAYVVNCANAVTQANLTSDICGWRVTKKLLKIRPACLVNTPSVAAVILLLPPMHCT